MPGGTRAETPVATVDVKQLNSVRWGPMRQLFPSFVDDVELGRYLKRLLADAHCRAVQLDPHRDPSGRVTAHVFDVFFILDPPDQG